MGVLDNLNKKKWSFQRNGRLNQPKTYFPRDIGTPQNNYTLIMKAFSICLDCFYVGCWIKAR